MKNRFLIVVVALVLGLSLIAGCAAQTPVDEKTPEEPKTEEPAPKEPASEEPAPEEPAPEEPAPEWPTKDLKLIVPWNAGGSSDLTGRIVTSNMEKVLGYKFSVVNTPGATGTVGMNDCFIDEHDGYTLIANATPYSHGILGLADWKPSDWDFLASFYVPGIIAVHKDSEYKTFDDLYNALKENPDTVTGGTAGVGSSGFVNMEKLKSVDPVFGNYKHIAYTGGAKAVQGTLAQEVDFTPQLSNEMVDLLRSGDLVALAALTEEDMEISGVGTIPSIKNFLPDTAAVLPCGDAFGIMFPSDIPDVAKASLEEAFMAAVKEQNVKDFGDEKGIIPLEGMTIESSNAITKSMIETVGYILYDSGVAEKSPEEFGYPRP